MQLESVGHANGLPTKRPATATVACAEFVKAEDKQACQDGNVWPLITLCADVSGMLRPLLSAKKWSQCNGKLGIC